MILGVPTNAGFLRRLLAHPQVVAGELDTGLVEREVDGLLTDGVPEEVYAAAALLRQSSPVTASPVDASGWVDPFSVASGWRLGGTPARTLRDFRLPGHEPVQVSLRACPAGTELTFGHVGEGAQPPEPPTGTCGPLAPLPGGRETARVIELSPHRIVLELAGATHTFTHAASPEGTWLGRDGDTWHVQDHDPVEASLTGAGRSGVDTLAAPMPGTVTVVKVAVGDEVVAGQSLLVVEAMKMEHVISAPHAGTVTELDVTAGSTVAMDQVLAVVAPAAEPGEDA